MRQGVPYPNFSSSILILLIFGEKDEPNSMNSHFLKRLASTVHGLFILVRGWTDPPTRFAHNTTSRTIYTYAGGVVGWEGRESGGESCVRYIVWGWWYFFLKSRVLGASTAIQHTPRPDTDYVIEEKCFAHSKQQRKY